MANKKAWLQVMRSESLVCVYVPLEEGQELVLGEKIDVEILGRVEERRIHAIDKIMTHECCGKRVAYGRIKPREKPRTLGPRVNWAMGFQPPSDGVPGYPLPPVSFTGAGMAPVQERVKLLLEQIATLPEEHRNSPVMQEKIKALQGLLTVTPVDK